MPATSSLIAASAISGSMQSVAGSTSQKTGRRALVEQAVGRGYEAERRGQDLIAVAPSQRCGRRGGGRWCRSIRRPPLWRPAVARRRPRNAPASGPVRAAPSAGPRGRAPPRARRAAAGRAGSAALRWAQTPCLEPARPRPVAASCRPGWNAYSSESTSASQEASITFSETPIAPHESCAVGGVEQDPGDGLRALVLVEDPDLEVRQLDLGELRMVFDDRAPQGEVERVDGTVVLRPCGRSGGRRPRP